MEKTVPGIFAHPDYTEFLCTGTLSLLKKERWSVHIAAMASGDKGTAVHRREEISRIRFSEAKKAAKVINASYYSLGFDDIYIFYDRDSINRTTTLIRQIRPSVVFTTIPDDYMIDHEITSRITQTACFSAGVKNLEITEIPSEPVPYLYYCDPIEGKDKFSKPVRPSVYVDITGEIGTKVKMPGCHESQRNWLMVHHKMDEYILSMKRFSEIRGKEINCLYAEGFRQHLGHSFLHNNIIKEILGDLVRTIPDKQE